LELEQPRSLLLPCRLGKLGVWVGTNRFEDRRDSLFKRLTLGRSGHLAFQADCPRELREWTSVPGLHADYRVDKLMGEDARNPHGIIEDRRDHNLNMSILAGAARPAFADPLMFGGEGTNARKATANPDLLRDGCAVSGEDCSKLLCDRV
jgi:hypothetical protein